MKRYDLIMAIAFFSLTFIGSLVVLIVFSFDHRADEPPLIAERETIDLGEVSHQQIISGHFVVKNQSRYPIEILRLLRSCSCTSVSFVRGELLPNSTTQIDYEFDTGATLGALVAEIKVLYVYQGDSANRARMLPLTLRVQIVEGQNEASRER